MTEKVYVLTEHREHEEYPSSSRVIDVYHNEKDAQARLAKEFKTEKEEWEDKYADDELEAKNFSENEKSLFNVTNGMEYVKFTISENEIK